MGNGRIRPFPPRLNSKIADQSKEPILAYTYYPTEFHPIFPKRAPMITLGEEIRLLNTQLFKPLVKGPLSAHKLTLSLASGPQGDHLP